MSLPSAEEVTNLFLYGQNTTPTDMTADSLIRPTEHNHPFEVNVVDYMNGPGRFATASQFQVVEKFLNPWMYADSTSLAPGTYTKLQLYKSFGISNIKDKMLSVDQASYDDGKDDFLERAYIWNTTGFQLNDDATFVVEANGNRYIDNLSVVPYTGGSDPENFDLRAGSNFGELANSMLAPRVDPSGIGRKVIFKFTGTRPGSHYSYNDYVVDTARTRANPLLKGVIMLEKGKFLDRLWNSGATRYLDNAGRALIYGTEEGETLSAAKLDRSFFQADIDARLRKAIEDAGVALVGGAGSDIVNGTGESDILSGGDGDDKLDGGAGNDQLKGGAGSDSYSFDGAFGKDIIDDVDGQGTIFVSGIPLLGGEKIAEGVYKDQSTGWTYAKVGADLVLAKDGDKDNSIVIEDWSAESDLDIKLVGELPIAKASNLTGDFEKKIDGNSYVFDESGTNYAGSAAPGTNSGADSPVQQGGHDQKFDDLLTGSLNNDTIFGLTGNDGLDGGAGDDVIDGGVGDDLIFDGSGSDTLFGGAGRDWIVGSTDGRFNYPRSANIAGPVASGVEDTRGLNWVTFKSASGGLLFTGAAGTLVDSDGSNLIDGGSGADTIFAGTGDDFVFGGADDDYIGGMAGTDRLYGGDGADTLNGDSTADTGHLDSTSGSLQAGDLIDGGAGDDNIIGQGGEDTLAGGEGNDSIWGDADDASVTPLNVHGNDHLDGGVGNDQLIGGGLADTVLGGDGDDKLFGDDVQSKVPTSAHGADYLDGGKGRDLLSGGGGDDVLYGGDGDDQLLGDDLAANVDVTAHGRDTLDGGTGADFLQGGGNSDFLIGGDDNDALYGDDGGGAKLDVASHGSDTLDGGAGADLLWGGGGNDILTGGSGDDELQGDDDPAELAASAHGDDMLDGGDGNDLLHGGGGNDTLRGGDGNDLLSGEDGVSASSLSALTGNDLLEGGNGNDGLIGGNGNDTLDGGAGIDYLTGGAGDDTYIIHAGDSATIDGLTDHIVDVEGRNTLVLDGIEGTATAFDVDASGASNGTLTLQFGSGTGLVIDQALRGAISYISTGGETHDFSEWLQDAMWNGVKLNSTGAGQSVYGGRGQDTLTAGADRVLLYGGRGNDSLSFGSLFVDLENHVPAPVGVGIVLREGDGNDILLPSLSDGNRTGSDINFIRFDSGISASGMRFVEGEDGTISLGYGTLGDTLKLGAKSALDVATPLFDELRFSDSSHISWSELCAAYAKNGVGGHISIIDPSTPVSDLYPFTDAGDAIWGGNSDDTINGGAGIDTLHGSDGNDLINGGDDIDLLFGDPGNDTLEGGLGDDELDGGTGDNVFLFGKGDGQDQIKGYSDAAATNTLKFKEGISASDVTVTQNDNSVIVLSIAGGRDKVTVRALSRNLAEVSSFEEQLQQVVFADGTVWDAVTLKSKALSNPQPVPPVPEGPVAPPPPPEVISSEEESHYFDKYPPPLQLSDESHASPVGASTVAQHRRVRRNLSDVSETATSPIARPTADIDAGTPATWSDAAEVLPALSRFALSASLTQFHLRDTTTALLGSDSASLDALTSTAGLSANSTAAFLSNASAGWGHHECSLTSRERKTALL